MLTLVVAAVFAASPVLESGAEARELTCVAGSPGVPLRVFRYTRTDGHEELEELRGEAAAEGVPAGWVSEATVPTFDGAETRRRPAQPGCPFAFPAPSADWHLEPARSWTAQPDGTFLSEESRATFTCKRKTLKAMAAPTSLEVKPGPACGGGSGTFGLRGGARRAVAVVECTLRWGEGKDDAVTLVFSRKRVVERVVATADCPAGVDYRLVEPR